ncbi:MAG: hypothetical protein LQ338_003104, partial [Usnochroma carphineum]
MKLSSMNMMLAAIALNQVSAVVLPEPEHHAIRSTDIARFERRDVGNAQYYAIAENEHGTVYSNVAPNQRHGDGDGTYYPVAKNDHGTVFSNVAPSTKERREACDAVEESDSQVDGEHEKRSEDYKPLKIDEVHKYMNE